MRGKSRRTTVDGNGFAALGRLAHFTTRYRWPVIARLDRADARSAASRPASSRRAGTRAPQSLASRPTKRASGR